MPRQPRARGAINAATPSRMCNPACQSEVAFSFQRLRGRTIVMNFIFTHCAASCPLQVRALTAVQHALPADLSQRVQFVSVTMDPARDTPSVLKDYAARMGAQLENWSFVTGHPAEIAWLHQHFGAQVKRLSGNTGRLYLNGTLVAQNTNVVLNPIDLGATTNVWLGRSQYTTDPYLNGSLDDVRISCRAYSEEEVAALSAM
ncbi:MAG TPA: SCO family protein [Polyangiales bacterium]|nr:SCO family protein [Polyangiales bacterium]